MRIALVLVGFSLFGVPVWSMTRERKPAPAIETVVIATPARQLRVILTFAEPPLSFSLKYLNEVLCEGSAPDREFSCDWKVVVPPEGVDLLLKAAWPPAAPKTAARVEISRDDTVLIDQTFWTESNLVQSVTIPGTNPE